MRSVLLACVLLFATGYAAAQSASAVLAAQIKKETGVKFTHAVKHQKTSGVWTCVLLAVKPDDPKMGDAKALGLLKKKDGKLTVVDYTIGTDLKKAPKLLQQKHKAPASIFPKKM